MIYLDTAAVVKLVHAEPESQALRGWLDERAESDWLSSVLVEIESFRALARYAPDAISRLPAVLDQIDLIDLGPRIRSLARAASRRQSAAWMRFTWARPWLPAPGSPRS